MGIAHSKTHLVTLILDCPIYILRVSIYGDTPIAGCFISKENPIYK